MSELNPQEPVPSPAPMDQPAYIPEVPEHTRTFLHFQTYPAVASWMRIHESLPFPRLLRPMLYRWAYSGGVRNYTERIDTSIDEALSRFDERVPQARVIRMRDIRDSLTNPFVSSATTVRNGVNSTVQLGDRYFLQPGRVVAASARKRYAAIYDTDGRALIRGQADSILAPVNDRLSNTLVAQFGDDAEVPRKEYSNEFSRGLRILNRAYENTLTTVLPRITAVPNHIEEVYSKNKEERGSYLLTSIETGRQLTTEAMARMGVSLYQADPEPIVLEDKEQIPVEGSSKNVESM
ncbi:unnamed protein product [Kuraishia capsulata CBS 1993]|uniref:Uncharacterized protein n=1 Tax=Kuraishia capsulata CBS 1993 TaxID=1382522 RepID=W6MSN6_9ASCO|nr:uncharacterized protein KUCA_T00005712001 [Kuraishia capsulata CBS 1993]CDK29719.1 unnamed protein product [Kuraishia capsulata CBS 1993]